MEMIGHHYPSQGSNQPLMLGYLELLHDQPTQFEVTEYRYSIKGVAGQQIDAVGFVIATDTQAI
ncbi:hypothetical protein PS907_04902 [Pseudomonas fluorescens]|nr:hypothetical protein PS907_04902 [Pseudomonas fluorescens]